MDLEHTFTVPVGVDQAWAEFQDISSVAQCFPGATVTGVEDDSFAGSVKVKLGPIALTYNGSGTFTERDETNHRFVVDAKGKDKRGNGTAGATVTLTMTPHGDASTEVTVLTDLAITGKPAQFGRGVMQDVSDKLLGQFVSCLESRLGESPGPAPEPPSDDASQVAPEPVTTATDESPGDPVAIAPATPPPAATPRSTPATPPTDTPTDTSATPSTTPSATPSTRARGSDDALNLGSAVLPVLAKTYWKPVVAAVVVIVVLVWIFTR
ncbi:MAG TPA: SRPBCC family protein [Nocardioides sp.]|uniref:SRPBCC family protein n=1 Tax=Nocardioides sp. TaxID=35761 RepID=UPI002E2F1F83|nr:SRPBCC family protein [Nocardioides sp.]HEX3929960.1 SRPBCC family protein [Nocardioides sp.]